MSRKLRPFGIGVMGSKSIGTRKASWPVSTVLHTEKIIIRCSSVFYYKTVGFRHVMISYTLIRHGIIKDKEAFGHQLENKFRLNYCHH